MGKEVFLYKEGRRSAEEKLNHTQRYLFRIIAKICGAVKEKYGQEGLDTISSALENWPNHRSAVAKAGIPLGEGTLGDLICRAFDPGDEMLFTVKQRRVVTEEPDEDHLLFKVPECNVADVIRRECPETCSVVVRSVEQGLARQVNPNIKVSGSKYLANGHDACYIYLEMTKPEKKQQK